MIKIDKKEQCCGCHACFNVCPNKAIEMCEDERGFKYPKIDLSKCTSCGLCQKVCPTNNKINVNNTPKAYACINKNQEVRLKSSSGGAFSLIAEYVIEKGGVVFGAAWNEDYTAVIHTYISKKDEIYKFRGAKYLQSNIEDCYKVAKKFLMEGKYVLFSGTPCQIAALKRFLNKDYEKLILQDIICHGVPSPLVWRKYRNEIAEDSQVTNVEFRNKEDEGWDGYHVKLYLENNQCYNVNHGNDDYMKIFLSNISLRESCTSCKFKTNNRESDITLADFWGINNVIPEMNDNKGTSLVIINSEKGEQLFKIIKEKMEYKEVNFYEAVKYNPSMNVVSPKNKNEEKFYRDLQSKKIKGLTKKYVPRPSIFSRCLYKAKRIVKKLLSMK